MGEAKVSRRIGQRILAENPHCCFCGSSATTVDHVPPKILFWGKRRPAGLETPSCDLCNHGTRKLDQAAGLFARIKLGDSSPEQQAEFGRLAESVNRNFPGCFAEMEATPAQEKEFQKRFGPLLRHAEPANLGPLVDDAIYTLGAKLGFALHYHVAHVIVPKGGLVTVRY
jgi:hypothetical protein